MNIPAKINWTTSIAITAFTSSNISPVHPKFFYILLWCPLKPLTIRCCYNKSLDQLYLSAKLSSSLKYHYTFFIVLHFSFRDHEKSKWYKKMWNSSACLWKLVNKVAKLLHQKRSSKIVKGKTLKAYWVWKYRLSTTMQIHEERGKYIMLLKRLCKKKKTKQKEKRRNFFLSTE